VYVCFGLRISERFALRWMGVVWLNRQLREKRSIVVRNWDDVKTGVMARKSF
jgi:hypothetical protein